ncbi:hypothetical protein Bpro_2359 [Polaromonas sp. JS666]|nr:hypothetical protein Bpro_2359 [Polaromonas sp. JS666]
MPCSVVCGAVLPRYELIIGHGHYSPKTPEAISDHHWRGMAFACMSAGFPPRHCPSQEIEMFGLTSLGIVHTAISLVAVAAGVMAFFRYKEILDRTTLGKVYVVTTIVTCLTGFGIFQHGGFGKPHALGIVTLLVLLLAAVAGRTRLLGRASPYVETVSYSATFLFHLIPAITETSTRLPLGAPLLANAEAPELKMVTGVLFVLFFIGATLQARRLHSRNAALAGALVAPAL